MSRENKTRLVTGLYNLWIFLSDVTVKLTIQVQPTFDLFFLQKQLNSDPYIPESCIFQNSIAYSVRDPLNIVIFLFFFFSFPPPFSLFSLIP